MTGPAGRRRALRLWFNQAYRGTYQLIGLLRQGAAADRLDLHVTGTHTVRSTPFLAACDTALPEQEQLVGEAFVAHALAFCAEHAIDVWVPGRERLAVSLAADRFDAAGVALMVNAPEALRVLADKARAHDSAVRLGVPVPRSFVVEDAAGFRTAYDTLTQAGLEACMKPVRDHGGRGFRVLAEDVGGYGDLLQVPSVRVHPDDVERRIAGHGRVAPLLVCEHLTGAELSVDVLARDGEVLAAVPRSKGGPRWTRQLVGDPAALAVTEAMVRGHRLSHLVNVQVRYGSGSCRLLEVNTRAASGLYQSAVSGLNLPYAALRLVLGEDVQLPPPALGATLIAYTEAFETTLPF